MPIYAYKCGSCGFAKDVLQKLSDAPLSTCPECSKTSFTKQVTAAGFQLKGSGWYVTDFKGGPQDKGAPSAKGEESKATGADSAPQGGEGAGTAKSATASDATAPQSKTPSQAPPPSASSSASVSSASSASPSSASSTSSTP
ncbi:MAG: FmdB family zinc ribbon protein, partial [Betaproteobacteria bacterium]